MLSQKAKYALKALIALAQCEEGALLQSGDIAAKHGIPKKFLDLILFELRQHDLVDSRRGKQGGYLLARHADEIMIGDVVRIMDGPLAPYPCASVTAYRRCKDCEDIENCAVRQLMREVRDAAANILDRETLAAAALLESKSRRRPARSKKPAQRRAKITS